MLTYIEASQILVFASEGKTIGQIARLLPDLYPGDIRALVDYINDQTPGLKQLDLDEPLARFLDPVFKVKKLGMISEGGWFEGGGRAHFKATHFARHAQVGTQTAVIYLNRAGGAQKHIGRPDGAFQMRWWSLSLPRPFHNNVAEPPQTKT